MTLHICHTREYPLKLIPCRKGNWSHVGSSPTSRTLIIFALWLVSKNATIRKSMKSTGRGVRPSGTGPVLTVLLAGSVFTGMVMALTMLMLALLIGLHPSQSQ